MLRIAFFVFGVAMAATANAASPSTCPAGATPLVILGSFHMEGSTEDLVSHSPADVTTPRRQAEIQALVAQLAAFRPTKVAIESSRISTYWNDRYAEWRKAKGALGSNEIEQVGFRLADAAGLERLSPVDYPMWMDGTTAAERHEPKPAAPSAAPAVEPDTEFSTAIRRQLETDDARLASGTIADFLTYLNSPARAVVNHRWDVMTNLAPGAGTSMYETTDYATNWYKRNLRIYTNLVDIAGPGERILLLIGAGHAHLLGQLAADDTRFCVTTVAELLASTTGR
jgi:hypothetical protein